MEYDASFAVNFKQGVVLLRGIFFASISQIVSYKRKVQKQVLFFIGGAASDHFFLV